MTASMPAPMAPHATGGQAHRGQEFNWLLVNFARNTHGVRDAIAVSSDGLLIAGSEGIDRAAADQLAAIVSGLTGLARSASRRHGFEGLKLIMIEMKRGFLLVSSIGDGSCVGVLAEADCDIGLIGYEIAVLVDRAGAILTPALIAESRQMLRQ
jgi:predicted regulator of Ras-like GTPase activity (Roadblock/LC7/MglB family)